MKHVLCFASLAAANFICVPLLGVDSATALDRTAFQGMALICARFAWGLK